MNEQQMLDYIALLENKVNYYQHLLEINRVLKSLLLNQTISVESLLNYLLDMAIALTGCEGASILLWDDVQDKLIFTATNTTHSKLSSDDLIGQAVPLESLAGTIFREKRLIEVENIQDDPRHYNQIDQNLAFNTHSLLGVPLISNNRAIGVLEVINKVGEWSDTDRENITILAGEAAIAIEFGQLVTNLQKANVELSELDKMKSDFIAIASHELRTPLGIILGYSGFLQEAEDSTVRQHASKVTEGALQLRRIIESMINLRYIKQKSSDLNRFTITVSDFINDIKRDMFTVTHLVSREIEFNISNPADIVSIDRGLVTMAVLNVLNNAASFSLSHTVIVLDMFADNGLLYIVITDKGIGIEEPQLERIFDDFYQVEDHMTRRHGGLGIGLSISRAIIEAHGGRIWAESNGLAEGATFTICLPLVQ
jgi:signal transduction histidine kinase